LYFSFGLLPFANSFGFSLQMMKHERYSSYSEEPQIPRHTVVFIRHGESAWNSRNIFTGWKDVPLTDTGENEAISAGKVMKEAKLEFDVIYTSYLKRAIKTSWLISQEMEISHVPIIKSWRWNEQMYGALEGRNKVDCVIEHGEEQVQLWRRSYDLAPPAKKNHKGYFPACDPKYASLTDNNAPKSWHGHPQTESLKDTQARVWEHWTEEIVPALQNGKRVLVCCHGNSLRGLLQRLDGIPLDILMQLDIPRATPLLYFLDENLKPIKHNFSMLPLSGKFLGDIENLEQKLQGEKAQCIPLRRSKSHSGFSAHDYMCPGF